MNIKLPSLSPGDQLLDYLQWARTSENYAHRFIELIVFTSIIPIMGLIFYPENPLYVDSAFPWLMLPPVLLALRYGVGWGISSALITLCFFFIPDLFKGTQFPSVLAVGIVMITVIVGDASTEWRKKIKREKAENKYLHHRMKEFSRDYHVLKVSHGHLEEHVAGQRISLREALQNLKPVLEKAGKKSGLTIVGSEIMAVFSQYGWIQIAGLYSYDNNKRLSNKPLATLGKMPKLPEFDPLVRMALEKGELVSVKPESHADEVQKTPLLAVVPLSDSQGVVHGIIVIKEMHFMAFQQENLNLLALLGGYIGDTLTHSRNVALTGGKNNARFISALTHSLRFADEFGVESMMSVMKIRRSKHAKSYANMIAGRIRSLDSSWVLHDSQGDIIVVILLPLIGERQFALYLKSVANDFSERFNGHDFKSAVKSVHKKLITENTKKSECLEVIESLAGTERKRSAA